MTCGVALMCTVRGMFMLTVDSLLCFIIVMYIYIYIIIRKMLFYFFVTTEPGIYSPIEMLDFGILRTLDEPKTLRLNLINTGVKAAHITVSSCYWPLISHCLPFLQHIFFLFFFFMLGIISFTLFFFFSKPFFVRLSG